MSEFVSRRRVEFAQTDMAGIVHFSNYYKWMEEVEHDYFRSIGLSILQKQGDGTYVGWPRVSASCHFESPLRYGDEFELRLRVERIGVKSLTFSIEFWRSGQRVSYGRMKSVCCVCAAEGVLKSIEIPQSYLAVIHEMPVVER
ncbi:acyl-CoA thioesterase [Planctomicrobium sp. SH664]|uniref:acyl-CoA thioesterase n=1 Tax=Planctomicrobium sp. SH664 TaxID=3448125 RepID=UPI003F5BE368